MQKTILALLLAGMLLLTGCQARDFEGHAEAIELALLRQLRSADRDYIRFTYADIAQQVKLQTDARRAPNAFRYYVTIQVPDIASLEDTDFGFTPPALPQLTDASESDIAAYEAQYRTAYEEAALEAMQLDRVPASYPYEVDVTVERIGGRWVCSRPHVTWIRDDVREKLDGMADRAIEASSELARLREAAMDGESAT